MNNIIQFIDYIGYNGPVILFASTFYFLLQRIPYVIAFTIGSIINTFSNEFLKNIFREPRPPNQIPFIDHDQLIGPHYYGFPSGHAQSCAFSIAFLVFTKGPETAIYFMTAIFITTLYQRWKYRRHSIKQLAAGTIIGVLFAWIIHYLTEYYIYGYKHRWSFI